MLEIVNTKKYHHSFILYCSQPINRTVLVTHVCVVFYALSFWIQMGTLPIITNKLDIDPITFGNLQTAFGVAQLLGGPLFGRFGDLYGNRTAFILSFISAFFSYSILGFADSLLHVFLSRLSSVFMHTMQGAQMIITDLSLPVKRSESLGKTSISYGVGMVVGPLIGGFCTKHQGEKFATFLAAGGCILGIGLIKSFIPRDTKMLMYSEIKENHPQLHDIEDISYSQKLTKTKTSKLINFDIFLSLIWRNRIAKNLLFIKLVSGIPIGILHSMFSILLLNHFEVSPQVNGLVLSYIGVLSMLTQGIIVGKLACMGFHDHTLIKFSVLVLSITYFIMSVFVSGIIGFCALMAPMVLGGSVFNSLVQGNLTKCVSHEHTGSVLGFSMAVNSFMRSISPTLGGYMFKIYGFSSFGLLGALCNGMLFIYLTFYMKKECFLFSSK